MWVEPGILDLNRVVLFRVSRLPQCSHFAIIPRLKPSSPKLHRAMSTCVRCLDGDFPWIYQGLGARKHLTPVFKLSATIWTPLKPKQLKMLGEPCINSNMMPKSSQKKFISMIKNSFLNNDREKEFLNMEEYQWQYLITNVWNWMDSFIASLHFAEHNPCAGSMWSHDYCFVWEWVPTAIKYKKYLPS